MTATASDLRSPKTRGVGSGRGQIVSLQLLRGLAASCVVIEHLFERYQKRGAIDGAAAELVGPLGQAGVFTFFAISGFIMVHVTARGGDRRLSGRAFLRSRFLRVAPLYYLTSVLMVVFAWTTSSVSIGAHRLPTMLETVLSALFIPYRGANGLVQPVYGLGWTLDYEMFFYLLFALGLSFGSRRGPLIVLGVLGALTVAGAWIAPPAAEVGVAMVAYTFTRPVMLYFAGGILIGVVRASARRLPVAPAPVIAGVAATALAIAVAAPTPLVAMAAIAVAVASVALVDPASPPGRVDRGVFARFAQAFGDASYSIYLTHSFLLGAVASATARIVARGTAPLAAAVLLACALCAAAGWVVWRGIERPLTDRLRGPRPLHAEGVAP